MRVTSTRRELFRTASGAAAVSALAGVAIPSVHAGEDNTIRLAIVGAGGRGTGALENALSVTGAGPVQLVAMADLFEDKLERSFKTISEKFPDKVDVPADRKFLGFDAFKHAIDCLRPGDVALLTTHSAFRPVHLDYAISKGVNVFMEKSFAPDPGTTQRVLKAGEQASQKNLKVACGLMCRHSVARQALVEKVRNGELGDVELIRANRLGGSIVLPPRPPDDHMPEILYQIRRPYFYHWLSSGLFIEMNIHQIDECCWIMDGWPVSAHGLGGRVPESEDCSQNLDSYAVEYTFANGAKALVQGRYLSGCQNEFATFIQGSKKSAQFSGNIHAATVHTYQNRVVTPGNIDWKADPEPFDPWQAEWNNLLAAIRKDAPYNETERACYTNLASILGRAAVHTGSLITWDEVLSSRFQFCPEVDTLTVDSTPPATPNSKGLYPTPVPGLWNEI